MPPVVFRIACSPLTVRSHRRSVIHMIRHTSKLATVLLAAVLLACETTPNTGGTAAVNPQPRNGGSAEPVAYVNGKVITWDHLRDPLIEAAGGQIFAEVLLDELIRDRLAKANITLTGEMIEREQQLLGQLLAEQASRYSPGVNPMDANVRQRLINELRLRRGLGNERFNKLMMRSAGLRVLVKDEVEVPDTTVQNAFAIEYGERYETRIIVADNLATAGDVARRAKGGESFVNLAISESTDASSVQGGYIGAVSPADPNYPIALRRALMRTPVGAVSDPVALERGFAIVKIEEKIPAQDVKYDDVKESLADRVRRNLEDTRIRQLRNALLDEADITVLNRPLKESYAQWRQQRGADRGQ